MSSVFQSNRTNVRSEPRAVGSDLCYAARLQFKLGFPVVAWPVAFGTRGRLASSSCWV